MKLTHFSFIFYQSCLLLIAAGSSTHVYAQLLELNSEEGQYNTDNYDSETKSESDETFSSDWSIWNTNNSTESQPKTIILPILFGKSDKFKTTNTSKEMESQIPTKSNEEGENTSVFQDASSALWNFMSDSDTLLKQLKNRSDHAIREIQHSGTVIGNAVESFIEVGWPKGTNTSFTEGFSNIATEMEAAGKEVEQWPIKDMIVQKWKDTAANLFTVMPTLLEESDSETIHVNDNYAGHHTDSFQSPTNNNMDDTKVHTIQSSINNMIILIVIGIIVIISIILSAVLMYIICTHRQKSKKISQKLKKKKKRSYSSEQQQSTLKLENINTQLEIEQRKDLIKDSKLDIELV